MPTDYKHFRRFNTCQEATEAIDGYFVRQKEEGRPFTISGLALALGMSRMDLLKYSKGEVVSLPKEERDCIVYTIAFAKSLCEEYAEESLFTGKSVYGAIFNLKNNYGLWKDRTELEVGGEGGITKVEIINRNETTADRRQKHNEGILEESKGMAGEKEPDSDK